MRSNRKNHIGFAILMPDFGRAGALTATCILIAAVVGCAQQPKHTNWQHSDIPQAEWPRDSATCARKARRELDREMGSSAATTASDNIGGGVATYNRQMRRYDLQNFEARVFATCMRRLGYAPVKRRT